MFLTLHGVNNGSSDVLKKETPSSQVQFRNRKTLVNVVENDNPLHHGNWKMKGELACGTES